MRKRIQAGAAAAIVLLLAGCDVGGDVAQNQVPAADTRTADEPVTESEKNADTGIEPQTRAEPKKEADIPFRNEMTNAGQETEARASFSYLEQLPTEKQAAYNRFKGSQDVALLTDFTPEEMVLAYLHTLSNGDPYVLYPLIYNGGYLSDLARFTEDYREYVSNDSSEIAMHYRYYDSIKVDELGSKPDYKAVAISVSVGIIHHTMVLGLREEDGIWKLDVYGFMKDQIKRGKEAELESKQ
ncbi:hypothetical protein ACFFSY_26175 [Paenibacillus aurantiacus]|uniref:Lipoprotein n=1 Tax=Paenibacillus aurantiacus TaxID=1936118 RepID=A0ABV5KXX1_9BACL